MAVENVGVADCSSAPACPYASSAICTLRRRCDGCGAGRRVSATTTTKAMRGCGSSGSSDKISYADFGGNVTPETFLGIGVGLALAAAAGFRVFVPMLVLSLAARTGWIELSPSFSWLATTSASLALATAMALEIAAYYVPFFDNLLDTIAAPVAVLAGIVASASVLTDLPPWLQYSIAIIGAGGTAGLVHASTSVLRLKSSAATAGLGNPILATLELVGSLIIALLAVLAPLLALAAVALIVWLVARRVTASLANARGAAQSSTR